MRAVKDGVHVGGKGASTHYPKDKGCSKAKKRGHAGPCPECPFPKCLEDEGAVECEAAIEIPSVSQRDQEIIRLWKQGAKPKAIAAASKLSRIRVYRIIQKERCGDGDCN